MKLTRSLLAIALGFSLFPIAFLSFPANKVAAQDSKIAIQRGYRTGYSDGYMAGYRDTIDNAAKKYDKHEEYFKADRAFSKDYGRLEDYRDGYQQGFEAGYDTGFEKRAFDATIPGELRHRGIVAAANTTQQAEEQTPAKTIENSTANAAPENTTVIKNSAEPQQATSETTVAYTPGQSQVIAVPVGNYNPSGDSPVVIPTDTELIVELVDNIDTQRSREGDKFQARIVSPSEVSGAIIEGRISKIQKPGRIKRRAEMLLSFDRIVLAGNRWSNFDATITEVLPVKGDNVKRVDLEGTVEGKSSVKDDSIKVGVATGTGAVVGAVAGGPVGAAVGAGVGAAFGVGAAAVERGKDIKLNKNQQLRIKTSYETQIR
ncbi:MAG: hypothetical protein M3033_05525 [Acidobacteriota bacterium]|nr:hypothetical protein [Acidobacteriota bacterium]